MKNEYEKIVAKVIENPVFCALGDGPSTNGPLIDKINEIVKILNGGPTAGWFEQTTIGRFIHMYCLGGDIVICYMYDNYPAAWVEESQVEKIMNFPLERVWYNAQLFGVTNLLSIVDYGAQAKTKIPKDSIISKPFYEGVTKEAGILNVLPFHLDYVESEGEANCRWEAKTERNFFTFKDEHAIDSTVYHLIAKEDIEPGVFLKVTKLKRNE